MARRPLDVFLLSAAIIGAAVCTLVASACVAGTVGPSVGGVPCIESGKYTVHYTKLDGGDMCFVPSDSEAVVSTVDAGLYIDPSCKTAADSNECRIHYVCTQHNGSMSDVQWTFSGSVADGTERLVDKDQNGKTLSDCTLGFTFTKQ